MPPTEITPRKVQEAVQMGFRRMENFRAARLMFLRSYVGQYYDASKGDIGTEPLNLIFNAIRVLVPYLVMNHPKHDVKTDFMAYRGYGDLLAMALDYNAKELKLRDILRRWIVDAIFTMGILKTGLCSSDSVISFDETDEIDPGMVYTEVVEFDNFVFDPNTHRLEEASFLGDRVRVPRIQLLDSGLYDNAIVERLPRSGTEVDDGSESLSQSGIDAKEMGDLEDFVDVVELWVPQAQSVVTVPGSRMLADDYLRVDDYYGPNEGPYTFLRLTPPIPNNPLPIAPVGVWHDLHVRANRMAVKIMDQADRQKDILVFPRAGADDAQDVVDSSDGDAIAADNPGEAKIFSFGGQQRSNEAHMVQLQMWFNQVAGNPEAMGGIKSDAATATQANILQSNASIGIEDMRDIVYLAVGDEAAKRAWYLHTDPLIEIPLIRRMQVPAQYTSTPEGQMMMSQPAQLQEIQVFLTPEARAGDFLDFHFEIQPKSMSRMDPQMRLQRAMEFAVKLIPAAATAAQICMQMGVPFSFPRFVTRMAREAGIEWMDEVFLDPEFQMQMAEMMMRTPGMEGSQGTMTGQGSASPGAVQQNINMGPPAHGVGPVPTPQQMNNQGAQQGANQGQGDLPVRPAY